MKTIKINGEFYIEDDVKNIGFIIFENDSGEIHKKVLDGSLSILDVGINYIENQQITILTYEEQLLYAKTKFLKSNKSQIETKTFRQRSLTLPNSLTGEEFEEYCCKLLIDFGYLVEKTKKTGDQGADILARRNAKLVAVQCKRYSTTVGNKSVQEIYAAKTFYGANEAWVMTNSSFTPSAKRLASKLGVKLFDKQSGYYDYVMDDSGKSSLEHLDYSNLNSIDEDRILEHRHIYCERTLNDCNLFTKHIRNNIA